MCYIEKCVVCNVKRKDVWLYDEVEGVVISGEDFGKRIKLSVGVDFYGRNQLSFWDNYDYVWYGDDKDPLFHRVSFKTISELNDYVNCYNKKQLEGWSIEGDTNLKQEKEVYNTYLK